MQIEFNAHLTSNELETYFLGHASAATVEQVEEHLILCEHCRSKLEETEMEIRVLRIALRCWQTAATIH